MRTINSNESKNKRKETKTSPIIGVGVLVLKEGKILLGLRCGSHGAGEWCFPGGHLEFGETFEGTALREVKEETGLEVVDPQFFCLSNDRENIKSFGKHYVTVFMKADYVGGEPRIMEPEKCQRWEWFDIDVLPKPLFGPTVAAIRCLKEKKVYLNYHGQSKGFLE